jgi:hypothetical protein
MAWIARKRVLVVGPPAVVALFVLIGGAAARAVLFDPVEGLWRARTSNSLPLSFEVHDGQVENVRFVYSAGACGDFESTGPNLEPIRKSGSWVFADGKGPKIEANFVAADRVEGIVFVPSTDAPGCPETEAHFVAAPGEAPPPPVVIDTTAPRITGLGVSHGRAGYRLSERATVSFLLEVRRPGRVVGQNCLPVNWSNRKRDTCSLWLPRRPAFGGPGGHGRHSALIPGAAALVPGIYRLTMTATDPTGNVGAATRRFVVASLAPRQAAALGPEDDAERPGRPGRGQPASRALRR